MNKYKQIKDNTTKNINEIINKYAFFAFSQDDFNDGLAQLKPLMQPDEKLVRIPGGGYIIASQVENLTNAFEDKKQQIAKAIADDTTGNGVILDMFKYELNNHEYGYTMDISDTLDALDYTIEDINSNPALLNGLNLAKKEYLANFEG